MLNIRISVGRYSRKIIATKIATARDEKIISEMEYARKRLALAATSHGDRNENPTTRSIPGIMIKGCSDTGIKTYAMGKQNSIIKKR
jgi:hypothetical protein